MSIEPLAFHGEEQISRLHCAGIDRITFCVRGAIEVAFGADQLGNLAQRQLHFAAFTVEPPNPSAASASRATSTSLNGTGPLFKTWTCSCPLPAINTMSPGRASPIAKAIALRRSGSITKVTPDRSRDRK